jgi:methenyltetrahydrofolate cyclohydrolase
MVPGAECREVLPGSRHGRLSLDDDEEREHTGAALALPDDGRPGLEDELAEELGDLTQLWLREPLENADPREHVDAIGHHRHWILGVERAHRTRAARAAYDVPMDAGPSYLNNTLAELLERVSARTPAPGGGSVAAIAVALAAGLATMAARFSVEHWDGAAGAVAQGEALRKRAAPLADEDAEAYETALDALRVPRGGDPEARDREIGDALAQAADVPLRIAEVATDVAELAAEVAERGNENLRGDAAAAAVLAEAGARVAANLVVINLTMREEDERVQRALWLADATARAAHRAVAATS